MENPSTLRASGPYTIRAAQRVCQLLVLLQNAEHGLSLPMAAKATGMPKSSVFRYLATLEECGFVERDPQGNLFLLGPAFLRAQAQRLTTLRVRAQPHLRALADATGETAVLGVLDGVSVLCLEVAASPNPLRLSLDTGQRQSLHATALGKAIASQLPDREVRALLGDAPLPAVTERTIGDPATFLAGLEAVRSRGFAIDLGEGHEHGTAVAVPLRLASVPAAIGLLAPSVRLDVEDLGGIVAALGKAARSIA